MQNNNYNSLHATEDSIGKENFRVAQLSDSSCSEIQDLEDKISKSLGKKISLVAYEDSSR